MTGTDNENAPKTNTPSSPPPSAEGEIPFSLKKSKYSSETFYGRWLNMLNIIDPLTLFVSQQQLDDAEKLLDQFKNNTLPPGVTNEQLWKARKIREAIKHPDTGETIPMPFRMSGFVPFGVPIVVGMLLPTSGLPATLFFQWLNQTHNALVNYYNRPINPETPTNYQRMIEGYAGAVTSAVTVSIGLRHVFRNSSPALKTLVPFFAVSSANVCNVSLMRRHELTDGIEIKDESGKIVGVSQIAAKKALMETAFTRAVLPFPVLMIPPIIMGLLNRMNWLRSRPFLQLPVQTVVASGSFGFALPLAIALFPQFSSISASDLEHDRFSHFGHKTLIYNKGL